MDGYRPSRDAQRGGISRKRQPGRVAQPSPLPRSARCPGATPQSGDGVQFLRGVCGCAGSLNVKPPRCISGTLPPADDRWAGRGPIASAPRFTSNQLRGHSWRALEGGPPSGRRSSFLALGCAYSTRVPTTARLFLMVQSRTHKVTPRFERVCGGKSGCVRDSQGSGDVCDT